MPDRAPRTALIQLDAEAETLTPVSWAVSKLRTELEARGVSTRIADGAAESSESVVVRCELADLGAAPESFSIDAGARVVVRAREPRGLAYGLTELADRVRCAEDPVAAMRTAQSRPTTPATAVRGVLRAFSSDVLDRRWLCDHDFWTSYLDELATHRINRLHLAFGMQYNYSHDIDVRDNYLCFAYPFLLEVPGWEGVGVTGLTAEERSANLAALRFASDEATRRGLHFQLGLWNHAVRPELEDSPNLRHPVHGLADHEIAEYSAAALRLLLSECPSIAGVTFRVHYEGGVPEAGRTAFWRTVFTGLRDIDRPLDVDMHSKGVDQELIDAARECGARVVLSAKYWAEHQGLPYHQASVRPLEHARPADGDGLRGITQNARRFTRYGYGDFLRDDRDFDLLFRIWPGTQRFLLWADPEIFAGYGRMSTIGGALGAELCEPLTFRGRKDTAGDATRDLYVDPALTQGTADWRKYAYEYRLWGRLMYDPDADRETWLRQLRVLFADAAADIEKALSAASKLLPLVTVTQSVSASNNFFWPEVFTDMPIARAATSPTYGFDLSDPGTWGTVSPFDPTIFEPADDFARGLLTGRPSGRYTPAQVATWLERHADEADAALGRARDRFEDRVSAEFRRVETDVVIMALLGRFFAGKIRAGIGYSLFRQTDDPEHLREGLRHYRAGRQAIADVVAASAGVYATNLGFGDRPTEQGHWRDRLAQVDADLAELARELDESIAAAKPVRATVPAGGDGPRPPVRCTPPDEFVRGKPLTVHADAPSDVELVLHVRHLNQADEYLSLPMTAAEDGHHTAEIPAEETDSAYPLVLFLTARGAGGRDAWLVPGLDETLAGQPYHVVPVRPR